MLDDLDGWRLSDWLKANAATEVPATQEWLAEHGGSCVDDYDLDEDPAPAVEVDLDGPPLGRPMKPTDRFQLRAPGKGSSTTNRLT